MFNHFRTSIVQFNNQKLLSHNDTIFFSKTSTQNNEKVYTEKSFLAFCYRKIWQSLIFCYQFQSRKVIFARKTINALRYNVIAHLVDTILAMFTSNVYL